MSNIFTLENITDDFSEKINIDELYSKKQEKDLKQLEIFNKMLNRIHVKIKTTAKITMDQPFCWFVVPEIIIGVPKFNQANCIAYLMDKLQDNKFEVKYYHPNMLFISWAKFVPSYIRTEIKKKTGIVVNEMGEKVEEEQTLPTTESFVVDKKKKEKKVDSSFKSINSYKPSGKFMYDDLLFSNNKDS
jgi:hypothetical protein